jgi:microcystin-dependent protein
MPNKTTNYDFNLPIVADPVDADLWGTQLNSNWTSIDGTLKSVSDAANAASGIIVPGVVLSFAGSAAPSKWLLCQGQAVSRTTYADLFSAIGTTYGIGDGSTTFNVPDLGGRVIAGKESSATRLTSGVSGVDGATLGAAGGDENIQQHNHALTDPGHTHTYQYGPTTFGVGTQAQASINANRDINPSGTTSSSTTGITIDNYGSGSSENVQPTLVMNHIIYAGV